MKVPFESDNNQLIKLLSLLNKLDSPATKKEEEIHKHAIFDQIKKKIEAERSILVKKQRVKILQIAASVILFLAIGLSSFYFGKSTAFDGEDQAMVELLCPAGMTQKVILSDGSVVTLNNKTKLTYPHQFNRESRTVYLDGEGYFDIAKDSKRPFIIETKYNTVRVLGTKFNFKSYDDDLFSIVSLDEGKVEFKLNDEQNNTSVSIAQGEQIIYNHENQKLLKTSISGDHHKSWMKGELSFKEASLYSICLSLEKRFNCNIIIKDDAIRQRHYSASFTQGESLLQILKLLSYKRDWVYTTVNDTIEIEQRLKP